MSANIVSVDEESLRKDIKNLARKTVEETLNALLDEEASELVGAKRYERTAGREAYRSDHYARKFVTVTGKVELSLCFEYRKASPNATASGPLGRSHLGLMSTKTSSCGWLNKFQQPLILSGITHTHNIHVCSAFCDHDIVELDQVVPARSYDNHAVIAKI